jgi:Fur family ferric uptake transcriptional regulator
MSVNESDLRQRGIRLTPQRRMILAAIGQGSGHMTAEEIHQRILPLYPDMNISTVYRNLERLLELRLIAVTDLGGGRVCYEALERNRHHHLICHTCGRMIALDDSFVSSLRERVAEAHGFSADIDHHAIWGVCAQCMAGIKQNKEDPDAHP